MTDSHGRYVLDADGNPVEEPDLLRWATWYGKADRHVALTKVSGDIEVSTVFLGLDHSYADGPPMLYETMIFGGEHDDFQERYATRPQAAAGHVRAVGLAEGKESDREPAGTTQGDEAG